MAIDDRATVSVAPPTVIPRQCHVENFYWRRDCCGEIGNVPRPGGPGRAEASDGDGRG
jgi:hypothetical protein